MDVGVLLTLAGAQEGDLVRALDAVGTGVRVVRRCADVAETLAAAAAGLGRVAVMGADLPGVDRTVLARLREAGVATVLVAEDDDVDRCHHLGADVVAPASSTTQALTAATLSLVHRDPAGEPAPQARHANESPVGDVTAAAEALLDDAGTGSDRGPGEAQAGGPDGPSGPGAPADGADVSAGPPRTGPGRLVVVWGPYGAPGRTTLAVNLAAELAATDGPVLLVDADTQAPSINQVLGLLEDSSGIAAAARQATHGRLDRSGLARLCVEADPGLRVLTGLSRPDRWRELPAPALEVVWEVARELSRWTVVDVGAGAEETGGGFAGALAPRRDEATRSALAAADTVIVVGAGEPVGMRRLVLALTELQDHELASPRAQRVVVVNRIRAGGAGPGPERAVHEALARFADVTDPVLVADDRAALDRAVLGGRTLIHVAPASPARAGVVELSERLTGVRPPGRRGRRSRSGVLRRRVR